MVLMMMVPMVFGNNVVFAASGDVYISASSANGGNDIDEGDDFDLYLEIQNDSGADIENVWVSFGAGASFQPSESGRDKPFSESITAGDSDNNTFRLFYTGGNDKNLPIAITYDDANGDSQTVNTSIYIRNADPEEDRPDPGPSTPVDTQKYKPVLELGSASIPQGKAGETLIIPLTITNPTNYEAKEIKITPDFSATDNPFSIEQMIVYQTIESLKSKKTATVEFQLRIDKYAEKKTYTLPLKIEYKNVYKDSFTEEKVIYINITNTNLPPQLVVREAKSSLPEIPEEENFTVTFDVWNMGTIEAKNVTVDLKPNENFYFLDNLTKNYLFEMKGIQHHEITYSLRPKKDLPTGTYGITILLQHDGVQAPTEYTMYVTVQDNEEEEEEEEKDDIDIVTDNIITPQESILVEQPFTVSLDVKNQGTTEAESVKITVEGGEKILPQSLNVININDMKPGDSIPLAFSFVAAKDSESKSYPIKVVIEYKNNDEAVKKEQYMGVLIENPEEDEDEDTTLNTIPKIIISEYSMDPVMVNAGENFTLQMKFLNTNKLKAVQNLKITLVVNESSEETGSVFTPVQSSNTFYIDYLAPGETSEKEMMMYTIPDAKAKTYVVKAVFEYEYEEQEQLKTNNMEDLFGIPVVQPAKLETTDVIVSEPAFVGEPVYISSEFYNMGKVTLSNLMVKVEGDFDTKESNYFVGNFDMGMSDYYEAAITPFNMGETKGLLVYTFEDAAGQEHRIEKEFTVNAMEAAPVMNPDFPGMDPGNMDPGMMDPGMMGPEGSKFPVLPVAIGGGVVVLIVVFIIIRKRRKRKKELMLDEDI